MLNKPSLRDKQLLAWDRERRRLPEAPVHLLEEPIQKGWKRHFVMGREATARPDSETIAEILFEIDTTVHHWRRDFSPSRSQLRHCRGMLSNEQSLGALCFCAWDRGRFPEKWRGYFRSELVPRSLIIHERKRTFERGMTHVGSWRQGEDQIMAHVFRFPRLFTLVTVRHWLTHVREIEPAVETRRAELAGYIQQNGGNYRLAWLYGESNCRRWGRRTYRGQPLAELEARELRAELGPQGLLDASGLADAVPLPRFIIGSGTLSANLGRQPKIFFLRVTRTRLLGESNTPVEARCFCRGECFSTPSFPTQTIHPLTP